MDESDAQITDGFPVGMSVLAVDDDSVVLRTLELLLLKCRYKVTVSHNAFEALDLLRANKDDYDLVISDVNMPDMDGFKLLEIVGLEMDLPVIMLSVDCDVKNVMKGIMHGAVDYLAKPVRLEELKLIWKHVVRRSLNEKKDQNVTNKQLGHATKSEEDQKLRHTKKCKGHNKESDNEVCADSDEDMNPQKKPRVTWSPELHVKFINIVNQLGISTPKKILDMLNISGLTRENVASHLQKYRKGLKKNASERSQQFFKNSRTSPYSGSFLSMTASQQRTAFCSVDRSRSNLYKNISLASSHHPAQQSCNGYSQVQSTYFSHSPTQQNNFCQQYIMNPHAGQAETQHLTLTKNSNLMKASTQVLSYQSFAPRSSPLDCNAQSFSQNSDYQIGHALDHQTVDMLVSNNLLDNYPIELDAVQPSEQELQQFSSCLEANVEMGADFNCDSPGIQSCDHEDYMGSGPFNFTVGPVEQFLDEIAFAFNKVEHTDDLHAALKQFRR
ncbi:two-component response regulator ORR23-like isoform X2 [Phalaenopsis equestris]|uniref:two-component response regulator ORR23-like isoform X2 n=1 Tax=Phalaenopsis equestris TaxID=78828 RepID=UPI0009E490DE|nr:two-component response regulator ORR23-like isoform X2 [Phalaenopsis equestris]